MTKYVKNSPKTSKNDHNCCNIDEDSQEGLEMFENSQ